MTNMDTWPRVDNPTSDARPLMTNDLAGTPTEIQGPRWDAIQALADDRAEVTGENATTGRLALEGVELGDTGWRDVTADLENGWTANELLIRRVGGTLFVHADALDPTDSTSPVAYTFPTGFRSNIGAGPNFQRGVLHTLSSAGQVRRVAIGANFQITTTTNDVLYGTIPVGIVEAWPTTLPGSVPS